MIRMSERLPQPEKEESREEEAAEGGLTPQEYRGKLRKLIEGIEG